MHMHAGVKIRDLDKQLFIGFVFAQFSPILDEKTCHSTAKSLIFMIMKKYVHTPSN